MEHLCINLCKMVLESHLIGKCNVLVHLNKLAILRAKMEKSIKSSKMAENWNCPQIRTMVCNNTIGSNICQFPVLYRKMTIPYIKY